MSDTAPAKAAEAKSETTSGATSRPIVVTGCSGFIGANLAAGLKARGARVIGIESPSGVDWRTRSLPGLEVVRLDLREEADVRAFIRDARPVAIFNCAAYGAYSVQTDARRIFDVNVLGVRHLLEAARETAGLRAFVQAGSSSEYGFNCTAPIEDAPTWPDSDYAVSKVAATGLIRFYARKHAVPAFVLRLYSVYGPYEDMSRLIPVLLLAARERRLPPLVSPEVSRDFVYVGDVARAFDAIVTRAPELQPGDIFNIGTGIKTTLADLTALAREAFGITAQPAWQSMPDRRWDHSAWYADARKAEAVLGWRATTSLRDGLTATMRWLDDNGPIVDQARRNAVTAVPR
jgi:dolichol-phosphate mannosyltransferase